MVCTMKELDGQLFISWFSNPDLSYVACHKIEGQNNNLKQKTSYDCHVFIFCPWTYNGPFIRAKIDSVYNQKESSILVVTDVFVWKPC